MLCKHSRLAHFTDSCRSDTKPTWRRRLEWARRSAQKDTGGGGAGGGAGAAAGGGGAVAAPGPLTLPEFMPSNPDGPGGSGA